MTNRTMASEQEAGADAQAPIEDFRVRTARQRRQQTSRRLAQAVFELAESLGHLGFNVEDIRARAELSRGAFYRYFPTLDALLDHLAGAVGAQLNSEMSASFDQLGDPAERIGLHVRYMTWRLSSDSACALLVSRAISVNGAVSQFARDHAASDFRQGMLSGRFDIPSLTVAVDLAHGMLSAILRRAIVEGYDEDRLRFETAFLLRACGVPHAEAIRIAGVPLPDMLVTDLRTQALQICSAPDGPTQNG